MNGIKLFRTGFSILEKYSIPATDWKSLLVTFSATEFSSEPSFEAYKKFLVWDWKNGETPLILPLIMIISQSFIIHIFVPVLSLSPIK